VYRILLCYALYRSARLIIGMIVASWVMSTIISLPPLFGLKDPSDYVLQALPINNASLDSNQYDAPSTSVALELQPYEYYDHHDAVNYRDWYDAEAYNYPMYYDEFATNETISSDFEATDVMICIISQNLVYTVFPLAKKTT